MSIRYYISYLLLACCVVAGAQQPQTQVAPISPINAKYVNGVAPGYRTTMGSYLTLNVGSGTSFCSGVVNTYAASTLTMTASTTNYVYLDTSNSCTPSVKTTAFTYYDVPVAIVITNAANITNISDVRTMFNGAPVGTATVPTINIGTVTTGTTASIYNSGTEYAAILNFILPATTSVIGWSVGSGAPATPCSSTVNNGYFYTSSALGLYQCSVVTGTYQWNSVGGGGAGSLPGGSNTDVQVNRFGVLGGYSTLTYTPSNGLSVGGPIVGNYVTAGAQSTPPASWIFDWTSPTTALASIGGVGIGSIILPPEDVNHLTNADKILLMSQYNSELAMKTTLDSLATIWSVSAVAYNSAVASINTTLIAAGAPSNWATIWPDGTTSGPWTNIRTNLANDWSSIAVAQVSLEATISAAQSGAAGTSAVLTAAANTLAKVPGTVSTLPTLPNSNYPAGKMVWLTSNNELYISTGSTWTELTLAASNISGALAGVPISVSSLPTLPNSSYPAGQMVWLTSNNELYISTGTAWESNTVAATDINGSLIGLPGVPVAVSSLPTLPNSSYPSSSMVWNTADGQLYLSNGSTWSVMTPSGSNITNGSITAGKILAGSITSSQIAANTITAANIAANTITAGQILAGSITAVQIAANTITASQIAAGTITATQIAANTITAGQILAGSITAAQMATAALNIGGPSSGPTEVVVLDPSSDWVAEVGKMSGSGPWGNQYGGWFKNLGIGGASPASPNLWFDSLGNLIGANGTAVSFNGNITLKNKFVQNGTTSSPTVSASGFEDLPELTASYLTFTTYGNPVFIDINGTFFSHTSGGTTGPVTDIGWIPSSISYTGISAPSLPSVTISFSGGGGSGAYASLDWGGYSTYNLGGMPPLTVWTYNSPSIYLAGGSGYSSDPTTQVTIGSSGWSIPAGTITATASISAATPVANQSYQVRVLMDGSPVLGQFYLSTDINGNGYFSGTQMIFASAGMHTFEVQAYNTSSSVISNFSRSFMLVELG